MFVHPTTSTPVGQLAKVREPPSFLTLRRSETRTCETKGLGLTQISTLLFFFFFYPNQKKRNRAYILRHSRSILVLLSSFQAVGQPALRKTCPHFLHLATSGTTVLRVRRTPYSSLVLSLLQITRSWTSSLNRSGLSGQPCFYLPKPTAGLRCCRCTESSLDPSSLESDLTTCASFRGRNSFGKPDLANHLTSWV